MASLSEAGYLQEAAASVAAWREIKRAAMPHRRPLSSLLCADQ
jgi:hypothetical protein